MNSPSLRPPARVLRPLLAAVLFLTALLPLRAEHWQTLELRISPGRAGHIFTLVAPNGSATVPQADNEGLFE